MDVTFFARSRIPGQYSLERVLDNLITGLGERVRSRVYRVRSGIRGLIDVPDAVLAQGDVNHIAGHVHHLAAVLAPRRTVMTVHDIGHLSSIRPGARRLYRLFWYNVPLRRVAAVIAVSEFTRRELLRVFDVPPALVRVIHDCVPAGLEPAPAEFHADCPTVLAVGTTRHKNGIRLVEAATGLRCRIVFIGHIGSALRHALERAAIRFEEKFDLDDAQLAECYRRSDIVYFASTYEGFGLPIIEAQTVGRPVITSRMCSMPEVGGDGALFVDPYDIGAIRRALVDLCESRDLRSELVGKGFLNVKRFDRETFANAHMDVYRRIAPR